jgi:16S rRNA C967 or C1407 C5-methylase (RsmB/RsmF family)
MGDVGATWEELAANSALLRAVSCWREDPDVWLDGSFERLPETVRVNPLRPDRGWVEEWLEQVSAKEIEWFNGPGSAWELPFHRGKAEGQVRRVLAALHETGRITRQEAVSMIPVLALGVEAGDMVLDMCASPGSKTTQISEHLSESGMVVANEVVSSRVNTLVSNVQRHGSRSSVVVNHDGRHIPRMPDDGFDGVLVDAPCSGSGTTRKNPEIWGKWSPSGGRSLQRLQIDLLGRALRVVKPGGRVVYSTCSLDPIENEAVVAEVLRVSSGVSLLDSSKILEGVPGEGGMTSWPVLNEDGTISDREELEESMAPPVEGWISESLTNCMRVWNDKVGGGGFFVAIFEKSPEIDDSWGDPQFHQSPSDAKEDLPSSPQPISEELSESVRDAWGKVPSNLWSRGKKILWSTPEVTDVWSSDRRIRGGRTVVPGGRWRPLKVIHIGLDAARVRKGEVDRVVAKAAGALVREMGSGFTEVSQESIDSVLLGNEPSPSEIDGLGDLRGGQVLTCGDLSIPVWIGARVSLMLSDSEKTVIRSQRGFVDQLEEE